MEPITKIKKRKLEDIVKPLLDDSETKSREAGLSLSREAADYGINLKDFLDLAVDLSEGEEAKAHANGLSGYEMTCAKLGLPGKNDYRNQITLAQASDTFTTKPGTRILFPYTIDSVLRWENRLDNLESVENMISGSRTIRGVELVRVIGKDTDEDRKTYGVPEGSRIPVHRVTMSERSVKIYKHGSGVEMTYEFNRRNALDLITPFAARIERDLNASKLSACTGIMLNGDGTNAGAIAVTATGATTSSDLTYDMLMEIAMRALRDKNPINTIAGNLDAYAQFVKLFGTAAISSAYNADQLAGKGGVGLSLQQNLFMPLKFVLNTNVPAGKLLCFNKEETIEELVEAGSRIEEETRAVMNQTITYVRTENTGYSLIFPKTRYLLTYRTQA